MVEVFPFNRSKKKKKKTVTKFFVIEYGHMTNVFIESKSNDWQSELKI